MEKTFPVPILYEDAAIFILNKPAGLAVQGGAGVGTSLDMLLARYISPRPLLVHRLDKDTSGVIVAAKNREAAARFSRILEHDNTVKTYMAVCVNGAALDSEGAIDAELMIQGRLKTAKTRYRKIGGGVGGTPGEFANEFALLEITLDTGRMHQIRRHLALLGAPVLGDGKYGDFSLNRKLKKERGLKHLLLHAARISFDDGGTRRTAEAPLPDYFTPFLPAGYTAPLAGLTADQAAESCR